MSKAKTKDDRQGVFYGSLNEDEYDQYHERVEEQFANCARKARAEDVQIVTWGFDVIFDDPDKKTEVEAFAEACAKKHLPGVPPVKEAL